MFLLTGRHIFKYHQIFGDFFRAENSYVGDFFPRGILELFIEFYSVVRVQFYPSPSLAQFGTQFY